MFWARLFVLPPTTPLGKILTATTSSQCSWPWAPRGSACCHVQALAEKRTVELRMKRSAVTEKRTVELRMNRSALNQRSRRPRMMCQCAAAGPC